MLDFNLTNYRDHPKNPSYLVYHYTDERQADYFQELLEKEGIQFERFRETEDGRDLVYFALRKQLEKKVRKLNFLAIGRYREPFIPNTGFRWMVLIISFGILGLAIVGWLTSE